MIRKFLADEGAASAIEYCLIATFIAGACLAVIDALGLTLANVFANISANFSPGP
jgi:Flp pilus assembly pilin Flp